MKQGGWIKIHRKMVDWEWYSNPTTFCVWMHLLIEASHEYKVWRGFTIAPGQLIASVKSLSRSTGLSVQQVRTALRNIQTTHEITIVATNRFSIITICKYDEYQVLSGKHQQTRQQTKAHPNNTINNNIEEHQEHQDLSKDIERFSEPSVDEVKGYIAEKGYSVNADVFVAFYTSKGWMVGKSKMKDWRAAVRSWELKRKQDSSINVERRSTDVPTNPDYTLGF